MTSEHDRHKCRWPDQPHHVVRICCTGRGHHRLERFGYARVWPETEDVDLRLRPSLDEKAVRNGTVPRRGSLARMYTELDCRQCPRAPRLQPATLRKALVGIAGAGGDRLDLSMLPF